MKIKEGFVLRNVMNEYLVMPTGRNIAKFDGAIALNEVSALVFEKLGSEVTREELLAAILETFEVDEATASADLDVLLEKFRQMDVIEE